MKSIARPISEASCSYRAPAGEVRTKSLFQSCTRVSADSPPVATARSRFSVAAAVWYARSSRPGSAWRASAVGARSLTMSPRYDGRPSASSGAERGFAYCPAMRASLTTGTLAP